MISRHWRQVRRQDGLLHRKSRYYEKERIQQSCYAKKAKKSANFKYRRARHQTLSAPLFHFTGNAMAYYSLAIPSLRNFAGRLNLTDERTNSALDLLEKYKLELPVTTHPMECAIACLYAKTCNDLPQYNLYSYTTDKVDKESLYRIYVDLQAKIVRDTHEPYEYEIRHLEEHMETVMRIVKQMLFEMFNIQHTGDQNELWALAQDILRIALLSGETTGRNPTPLVTAIVVLAVVSHYNQQIQIEGKTKGRYQRKLRIDWDTIADAVGRPRVQTIRRRYIELVNLFITYANRLPIYSCMNITDKNLHLYLVDVIATGKLTHGAKNDFASSLPFEHPAYVKNQKEILDRKEDIRLVYEALKSKKHYTELTGRAQLVYVLLAYGTPQVLIENMSEALLLYKAKSIVRLHERYQHISEEESDYSEEECTDFSQLYNRQYTQITQ